VSTGQSKACVMANDHPVSVAVLADDIPVSVAESVAQHNTKPETLQLVEDPIAVKVESGAFKKPILEVKCDAFEGPTTILKVEGGAFKEPQIQHMQRGTEPDGDLRMDKIYDKTRGTELITIFCFSVVDC
jgi:hypothetical protein